MATLEVRHGGVFTILTGYCADGVSPQVEKSGPCASALPVARRLARQAAVHERATRERPGTADHRRKPTAFRSVPLTSIEPVGFRVLTVICAANVTVQQLHRGRSVAHWLGKSLFQESS